VQKPVPQAIEVSQSGDVGMARRAAKAMAQLLGFDERTREELTLIPLREGDRTGIQIESVDRGPGIQNVEQAVTDGFSTAGSLGYGLGAVNRLMDEFEIASHLRGRGGARIVCQRWVAVNHPRVVPRPLDIGAATRPHPAKAVNGDAFVVQSWDESALVGVIDGVGHGELASQAAQTARLYVESHFDRPLSAIFAGVGRACHGTYGVVMALARFDWARERLTFASVGNVESRLSPGLEKINIIVRRGILGLNAPHPAVTEHRWEPARMMVLHSDGLVTHWRWEDFPDLQGASATRAAGQLLRRLARDDDDATVVVVKGAPQV
jgi:serine/threonine protein phosphatase PrpC